MNSDLPEIPDGPLNAEPRPMHLDRDDSIAVLTRAFDEAGVTLGAYDQWILHWLAGWEGSTVLTVASWIRRAAQREAS